MDKVSVIERSLRAFVYSLIGLVPVLGLPLAVQAFTLSLRVQTETAGEWNPARFYVRWAIALSIFSLLFTFLAFFAVLLVVLFS
jgi:hypothetical protein